MPEYPLAIVEITLLDERAISQVDDRSRPEFVGCEEIRQDLIARAVVLRDGPDEELTRELIRRPAVDDVQVVNAFACGLTIERDVSVRQSL